MQEFIVINMEIMQHERQDSAAKKAQKKLPGLHTKQTSS